MGGTSPFAHFRAEGAVDVESMTWQRYELVVDAAGGMSFMPLPDVPPRLSSVDE